MIEHQMGNAIPPANKTPRVLEWTSTQPGEPPTNRSMMVPAGMAVRDNLRDNYWCAIKMHHEFAAVCKAANVALPIGFVMVVAEEVIGHGIYASADAHDRAFADCAICEAEWQFRGCAELPMIAADLSEVPEDQRIAIVRRTGALSLGARP